MNIVNDLIVYIDVKRKKPGNSLWKLYSFEGLNQKVWQQLTDFPFKESDINNDI